MNTVGFSFWILYEVFTMSLKLGVYSSNVAQGEEHVGEEHLLERSSPPQDQNLTLDRSPTAPYCSALLVTPAKVAPRAHLPGLLGVL